MRAELEIGGAGRPALACRRARLAAGAAAAGALLAACSLSMRAPEVHMAGVRLGGIGLEGGLLYVELQVINPNRFSLETAGLTYDLEFSDPGGRDGWVDFAAGSFPEEVKVESHDSAMVAIPVRFTYSGVGGAIRSIIETGTFDYRVRGVVTIKKPVRSEVPYRRQGTVSLAGVR